MQYFPMFPQIREQDGHVRVYGIFLLLEPFPVLNFRHRKFAAIFLRFFSMPNPSPFDSRSQYGISNLEFLVPLLISNSEDWYASPIYILYLFFRPWHSNSSLGYLIKLTHFITSGLLANVKILLNPCSLVRSRLGLFPIFRNKKNNWYLFRPVDDRKWVDGWMINIF